MKEQSKLSRTICYFLYFQIEMALKKAESQMLAKRVVIFFKNESKEALKHTVNDFKKVTVPVRTIYNTITRYRKHNSTNYLPKTGRPKKISHQELKTLVRLIDNKVGVSQHRLGRRFGVNRSTISRNLKKRTSVRVYKRRSAPKYISENQQKRAKSNCLKLYKKISPSCQLILDDEKYFTLSGNVPGNNRCYSSDTSVIRRIRADISAQIFQRTTFQRTTLPRTNIPRMTLSRYDINALTH